MTRPSDKPIRVALIGVSGYGGCYYRSLLALAEEGCVQLCAATVINAADEAEKCARLRAIGCRIYSDYTEMLTCEAGQIDLCCIPTGIGWHCTMTVAAFKAGMHVLVEKPPAATLEEVEAMRQARDDCGKHLFVGFQKTYTDACWDIKDLLLSGQFGTLKRIRVCALWPRSTEYYRRTDWAGKLTSEGMTILDSPANNAMAHFIQMALFWAGERRESAAEIDGLESALYRAQRIESFDTISARATLRNGAELTVNMSHSAETFMDAEIVIETTAGCYTWNDTEDSSLSYTREPQKNATLPSYEDTRLVMLRHICECLHGHPSNVCTLEMARAHTQFIDRIHRTLAIEDVPEEWIQSRLEKSEEFIQVKGLAESMIEAHRRGCLLSEVGLPWGAHVSAPTQASCR